MNIMTEPDEWIELAVGYDKDTVRVIALAGLARAGYLLTS